TKLAPQLLLEDGFLAPTGARAGEITSDHIANARAALQSAIEALDDFTWLGEVVTEVAAPGDQDDLYPTVPAVGESVRLNPTSRVAWMESADAIDVFVDGEYRSMPLKSIRWVIPLCEGQWATQQALREDAPELYEYLEERNALTDEDAS
ncbi:MAG: hypothetical protein ISQ00_04785, partial [Luminiphilus sp.]|nr:hypothetical protein [Luminiphilus sp.]